MLQNDHPFTDEQIDQALYGLITEIEIKEVKDLEVGDLN